MELKTAMWYQKKEKLINGPTIPTSFLQTNNGYSVLILLGTNCSICIIFGWGHNEIFMSLN